MSPPPLELPSAALLAASAAEPAPGRLTAGRLFATLALLAIAGAAREPFLVWVRDRLIHDQSPLLLVFYLFWDWYYVFIAVLPELVIPVRAQTAYARLRGVPWRAIEQVISLTSVVAFQQFVASVTPWRPLFRLDLTGPGVPWPLWLVGPFLSLFLVDFFYYWFHRAQHRFSLLWRLHSVHHAIRDLNALNVYHHWTERFLWVPFILVPISLLVELQTSQVVGITFFVSFFAESIHSNAQLYYGPLRVLLAEPRFHRIHHSLVEHHRDHNFCAYFPIIDSMFGTAYFPADGEDPPIGLEHQAEVRTLSDYVLARGDRLPSPGAP